MFDLLTILTGKAEKTFTGTFYEAKPKPTQLNNYGIAFDYEIVDNYDKAFNTVIGNLSNSEYKGITIKTNDPLEWRINSFVALQEGGLYAIEGMRQDNGRASKEAFRMFTEVAGVEYVLRLIEVDNPMRL